MADSSYQVIARRYRPQVFADLIGQKSVVSQLQNEIRENRNGHGYLFCGPRGTGKTSTARIFAKALNCVNGPTTEPCGKCSHCLEIANGTHLDVIEVDAATYTKADDTKALLEGLRRSPFSARDKIYIIDEVHMLSTHSFNALLKSLEEPPDHVVFILATTNPEKIPETVISRCRRLNFDRIDPENIVHSLDAILQKENVRVADGEREAVLKAIALASEGGLRDAQVLLDQLISLTTDELSLEVTRSLLGVVETDLFHQLLAGLARRDVSACLELVGTMVDRGRDLQRFVKMFLGFLRDAMLVKAGANPSLVRILDARDTDLQQTLKLISLPYLLNVVQQFIELETTIRGAVPPRFLLEFTLIKLTAVDPRLLLDTQLGSSIPGGGASGAPAAGGGGASSASPKSGGTLSMPQSGMAMPTHQARSFAAAPILSDALPIDALEEESAYYQAEQAPAPTLEVIHTSEAQRREEWVNRVAAQLPVLRPLLENAPQVEATQQSLRIALHPRDRVMKAQFEKPENVLILRKEARSVWGRPLMVELTEPTPGLPIPTPTPAVFEHIELESFPDDGQTSPFHEEYSAQIHDMGEVLVEQSNSAKPFTDPLTLEQALEQYPEFRKACELFSQHLAEDKILLNGIPLQRSSGAKPKNK
ncbi:MAG: DNA polymerase III subunit gamma/tau [Candidatus Sumerlaeia bacterium]|nr:DNA polymerase III subunit gamma/tau [Candidatus Sumerlaeia bacterium]